MGQIIQFPRVPPVERPRFSDWLTSRVGGTWTVVRARNYKRGWKGMPWPEGHVLLLNREYSAYEREYEAKYGPMYPWR